MTRRNSFRLTWSTALGVAALSSPLAHAWYGPICFPAKTSRVNLTLPSLTGETPGDLKVDFDDNSGQLAVSEIRASKSISNAHEIILARTPESELGVVGVILTSPRSHVSRKYELEFRKEAAECTGAIIRATEKTGESERPRRTRVQAKPVPQIEIQAQEPVTAPAPETYPAAESPSELSSPELASEPASPEPASELPDDPQASDAAGEESPAPPQPQQVQAPSVIHSSELPGAMLTPLEDGSL